MLAGDIYEPGRIRLIDIAEPKLGSEDGPGKIVFQPTLGCLCGSDIPYFNRDDTRFEPEMGHSLHEMIGTVADSTSARFAIGDRVLHKPDLQHGLRERFTVKSQATVYAGKLWANPPWARPNSTPAPAVITSISSIELKLTRLSHWPVNGSTLLTPPTSV